MSRDSSGGSVMLAFVLGAVAGAAVALLFAPGGGRRDARVPRASGPARAATGPATRPVTRPSRAASSTSASATASASAIERGREAFQQAREEGRNA